VYKEIGSNFWIDPAETFGKNRLKNLENYHIIGSDIVFLSTGRGAEGFVLNNIEQWKKKIRKIALIPSFTCETVIRPFLNYGYQLYTYSLDSYFMLTGKMLQEALEKSQAQVVLVHRYFGFDTLIECEQVIEKYRQQGVVFIEDRTQCLYSNPKYIEFDYTIGSLRKWGGHPDGAYAVCKEGKFENKPREYNVILETAKIEAGHAKYRYISGETEDKGEFLTLYQKAERILEKEQRLYKISPMAEAIQASMNIESLKKKRRRNYMFIYNCLAENKKIKILTPKVSCDDVPFYFVIFIKNRDALQKGLCEKRIYTPIIWPRANILPHICEEAESFYENNLCLPIDQRYELDDMERMVDCLMAVIQEVLT